MLIVYYFIVCVFIHNLRTFVISYLSHPYYRHLSADNLIKNFKIETSFVGLGVPKAQADKTGIIVMILIINVR